MSRADTATPSRKHRVLRRTVRLLWVVVGALALLLVLRALVIAPYRIPTSSMEPTLLGDSVRDERAGDTVLVLKTAYLLSGPRRWDLVAFRSPKGGADDDSPGLVKRVVGLPGETVQIVDGEVSIDGRIVEKPAGLEECRYRRSGHFGLRETTLGPDEYFVLGDNSLLSEDSRHWGALERERIFGRVVAVVLPLSRATWLERAGGE